MRTDTKLRARCKHCGKPILYWSGGWCHVLLADMDNCPAYAMPAHYSNRFHDDEGNNFVYNPNTKGS